MTGPRRADGIGLENSDPKVPHMSTPHTQSEGTGVGFYAGGRVGKFVGREFVLFLMCYSFPCHALIVSFVRYSIVITYLFFCSLMDGDRER
jgi:hypothetical protein